MRVLLLGSGGREHALAIALRADPTVTSLTCAPGNPGMARVAQTHPVDLTDLAAMTDLAVRTQADLVVVGPEAPLVAGVADAIRAKGIAVFGPSAAAARLEGSKAFAKSVMASAGVPTAGSRVCRDARQVAEALDAFGPPYVVKDDGLAAGKGVVVTKDRDAALAHAASCGTVVVEEFLSGPEASLFVVTDGSTAVPLLPAQDFKRIGDGDTGPNTGGMGAYAPLPWAPPTLVDEVLSTIVRPTLAHLREQGTPFTGLLYVGLALTPTGPKVIEFNCRFGDPETQSVLALLDSPLGGLLLAAATGKLADHPPLVWRPGVAVTVVLAAAGYPGPPRTDDVITGAWAPGVTHAGTRLGPDGELLSAGGRVLGCTGTGSSQEEARVAAYHIVESIAMPGVQFRRDIAAPRP